MTAPALQKCPACGAKLSARAKFCSECGTPTARGAGGGGRWAWAAASAAVLALVVTVTYVVARRGGADSSGPAPAAGGFVPGQATTDLSQLTPRQAADRLYDRVARAMHAGDSTEVEFFGPMALEAYRRVGQLDADARLHVGLIEIALGNPSGALAQADSIQRTSRTHLFAALLRARVAAAQGNRALARRALQTYLANYAAERAKNLAEYQQHQQILDETRGEAQRQRGTAEGS